MQDQLVIAEREFRSRLLLGTGKYDSSREMRDAVLASRCELVTVAVRRIDLDARARTSRASSRKTSCSCRTRPVLETAEEAIRVARLARAGGLPDWIKLEVIPDPRYLLPDPVETLRAAASLVDDGFTVLPYVLRRSGARGEARGGRVRDGDAARLADRQRAGTQAPRLDPNRDRAGHVPVVVDAGLGSPSHAAEAMEMGADAVLVNTAIARAGDPVAMAHAFRLAVEAGREAFLAGVMGEGDAEASSPAAGVIAAS